MQEVHRHQAACLEFSSQTFNQPQNVLCTTIHRKHTSLHSSLWKNTYRTSCCRICTLNMHKVVPNIIGQILSMWIEVRKDHTKCDLEDSQKIAFFMDVHYACSRGYHLSLYHLSLIHDMISDIMTPNSQSVDFEIWEQMKPTQRDRTLFPGLSCFWSELEKQDYIWSQTHEGIEVQPLTQPRCCLLSRQC